MTDEQATGAADAAPEQITVYAPDTSYNGMVAGVQFFEGNASVASNNRAAMDYFKRAGYGIGQPAAQQVAPITATYHQQTGVVLGTPLRDASVQPRASDYLPPTNAGHADPHGPLVVAPGIHGLETKPIRPGDVAVDNPDQQNVDETELAQRIYVDGEPVPEVIQQIGALAQAYALPAVAGPDDAPPTRASKADWVAYAVARGMAEDDANDMSKADLQAHLESLPAQPVAPEAAGATQTAETDQSGVQTSGDEVLPVAQPTGGQVLVGEHTPAPSPADKG
jgi:hypothetical protein